MTHVQKVDYANPQQANDLLAVLDSYARDPMGGNQGLSDFAKNNLIDQLKKRTDALSFLLYDHETPIGLANCFEGFSTFACAPLINIHDLVIIDDYRSKGLVQKLLEAVAEEATSRGCVKLTLEVLSNNIPAQKAYSKFGFSAYELSQDKGHALFWEMKLK